MSRRSTRFRFPVTVHCLSSVVLCFGVSLLAAVAADAQTVTGRLVDPDAGTPVGYANVLLYEAADSVLANRRSTLVKAELSDLEGGFTIAADSGSYYLMATMLGYGDYTSEVFELGADVALGDIGFGASAQELSTAVVTAKTPFLEQQAGKMVVNVGSSIVGQTGSATQLLQKVPGLVVRQGSVSLAGAASVTILIDGKPTRYMDIDALLKDLPAADIEKVEVITQPGAQYEAAGGGVINIVLKKNVRLGTNGSVRLGVGRGTYDKLNASVRLSHRDGPLNVYGTAGYRRGSGFDQLLFESEVNGGVVQQDNIEPFLPNTASLRGGVDYDLDERHAIGISGRYANTVDNAVGLNATRGYGSDQMGQGPRLGAGLGQDVRGGKLLYDLTTENVNDQTRVNYAADAFYRFEIDTAGQELGVDVSYGAFDRRGFVTSFTEVLTGEFVAGIDDVRNDERGDTRVAAVKVDYARPLGLRSSGGRDVSLTLHTGANFTTAAVDADLRAERRPMGSEQSFVNAPGLTNRFLYNERIAAAYLSADAKLGEATLNAGLRYEHTFIDGENVTSDSAFVRDYGRIFPSFGVSLPVKGPLGATGAYSYRIDRPNYRSLNPFVRYMGPVTIQRGNTLLQPEYIHNAEVGLTYDGQPFFKLSYSRTTDAIQLVTEQIAGTAVTEAYSANLDTYTRYGGQLFAPLSFLPRTDGYIGGMAFYEDFESQFLGEEFSGAAWEFTGFANATVSLPLSLKLELNYWIQSGGQQGIIEAGTVYGSSVGLQRKFLDDRLVVAVSYEDGLFDPWEGKIRNGAQRIDVVNVWETDIAMVNVTWKFGNRYLKGQERRERAAQGMLDRAGD